MDRGTVWLIHCYIAISVVLWLFGVEWKYIGLVELGCVAALFTPIGGIIAVFATSTWNGWSYDDGSPDEDPPIVDAKFVSYWTVTFLAIGGKALWETMQGGA